MTLRGHKKKSRLFFIYCCGSIIGCSAIINILAIILVYIKQYSTKDHIFGGIFVAIPVSTILMLDHFIISNRVPFLGHKKSNSENG